MMFLLLLSFLQLLVGVGSNFISKSNPLFFRAFWYGGMASLNTVSLAEMLLSLLFTAAGMFWMIEGEWLLFLFMYMGESFGFM